MKWLMATSKIHNSQKIEEITEGVKDIPRIPRYFFFQDFSLTLLESITENPLYKKGSWNSEKFEIWSQGNLGMNFSFSTFEQVFIQNLGNNGNFIVIQFEII